jgi:hypothetical protein
MRLSTPPILPFWEVALYCDDPMTQDMSGRHIDCTLNQLGPGQCAVTRFDFPLPFLWDHHRISPPCGYFRLHQAELPLFSMTLFQKRISHPFEG